MANELETKVTVTSNVGETINQFKLLKNSLKDAIGELAGLEEGSAAFTKQAAKVGQLKDQVNALNEAVGSVSGSPIENLSGSFGLLSQQVGSLDFDGAKSSLTAFSGQIKNFSFKDVISGAKSFVGTLGTLGKALLANPIFLIGGVIVALGAAIYKLKDSVKIIGDAFAFFGDILDTVVQAGKDFLDFVGLSNFATEDKAAKTIAAAKAEQTAVSERYDREIKIAQAAGKDTKKLEEEKRQAVLQTIKDQVEALKSLRKVQGEYTKEQIEELKSLSKQFNDIETEKAINDAKRAEEQKKKNKVNNDAKLAANKQLLDQIEQQRIASIKDEETRELDTLRAASDKRVLDIQNSKASKELKSQALIAEEKDYQRQVDDIVQKHADIRLEKDKANKEAYLKSQQDFNQRSLLKSNELALKDAEIELSKAKSVDERFKIQSQILALNTQKQIIDITKAGDDELAAQKDLLDKKIINEEEYAARVKKINEDTGIAIAQVNEQAAATASEQKKAQTEAKYAEFKEDVAAVQGYVQVTAEAINSVLSIIQQVRDQKRKEELTAISEQSSEELALIDAQLKAGQINKEQADQLKYQSEVKRINAENKAKEKAFEEDKKMRIAQTIIATITGALSAFAGAMQLGPIAGPIVGGILGTLVTVGGAVAVSNISKQKFQATSLPSAPSGGGAIGAASAIDGIQSSKFKAETIGQAGTSDGKSSNSERSSNTAPQRVYVLEADITNTQNKVKTIEDQAKVG